MIQYPYFVKQAATPHPDDPLTRLRKWNLPYRTPHEAEYYTAEQIRDLQELAKRYKLEGADEFAAMEPRRLRYQLNGIIDNKRAWQRALATKVNPEFQVAAAIHDIEFGNADGQDSKALEANARMKRNLQLLSAATSRNKFTGWWNANVHANIYKAILDAKYHDNLMAAWEKKQQKMLAEARKAERDSAVKEQEKAAAWDPDVVEYTGTEYALSNGPVTDIINKAVRDHYARILASIYKKSTGKQLDDPEGSIKPRIGYLLGHAANVNPKIVKKLKPEYRDLVTGWNTTGYNVTPGVLADGVDILNRNNGEYTPLDLSEGNEAKAIPLELAARYR